MDLILTDPPYNVSQPSRFHTMGRAGIDFGEWDKDFDQTSWLPEAYRTLKPGGSMVVFNDWKNLGDIARHWESLGGKSKDPIRWVKTNPMPRNRDRRYITDFEMALWLVKPGGKWVFNRKSDAYDRPEYSCASPGKNERVAHPTQKPVKLMEELLATHSNPGDIVLDPFIGSGTSAVAARNLLRHYIGFELSPEYYKTATERLYK